MFAKRLGEVAHDVSGIVGMERWENELVTKRAMAKYKIDDVPSSLLNQYFPARRSSNIFAKLR